MEERRAAGGVCPINVFPVLGMHGQGAHGFDGGIKGQQIWYAAAMLPMTSTTFSWDGPHGFDELYFVSARSRVAFLLSMGLL